MRSRSGASLGVNRISIGVQSFHDDELRPLGRVHGRAQALEAVRIAASSGVRTSLDLILGLPRQTAESFEETLETAIATGAGHVSLYMLDLEEGTALARQVEDERVTLPDDDLVADALHVGHRAIRERRSRAVRDQQLRAAGRGVPPQPSLLAPRAIPRLRHRRAFVRRRPPFRQHARHPSLHRRRSASRSSPKSSARAKCGARRSSSGCGRPQGIDYDDVVRLCGAGGNRMDGSRLERRVAAAGGKSRRLHPFRFPAEQRVHLAALLIAFAALPLFGAGRQVRSDSRQRRRTSASSRASSARRFSRRPCSRRAPADILGFDAGVAATRREDRREAPRTGAPPCRRTTRSRRTATSACRGSSSRKDSASARSPARTRRSRTAASRRGAARSTRRCCAAAC